jgi:hypothetical protein
MFSIESLERGIEASNKNIEVFRKAIRDEEAQQEAWRNMIVEIREREHKAKLAEIVIDGTK